ncbi:diguanylate cyclase (GGDEF) domain-containing protein [Mycolicibacterium chubuense NBB4]|uniref:Diguanylate cyclase (GGDEF) domain-containing protein n=1 Tax=Mycolicibacterium chubuense (strain NBB4) TaxID=710421 RepID=I4BIC5_MYCCN|nr:bifunctional diguanylate cyclase/phosphodiesterase [Mycolicibacterium chubuense]AFM17032.1 diguanylate cyclase (GGDEF) domain-containing protein [Mycolicibacterium chubuense NBB4]
MDTDRQSPRVWPSIAAPAAVAFVLAIALVVAGDSRPVQIFDDLTSFALSTYAAVCSAVTARSAEGRLRAAWAILAVALTAWALGDGLWFFCVHVLGWVPYPSPADLFYVAFTLLAAVAMVQFPSEPTWRSRLRTALDGATVALCTFLLAWMLSLHRVYDTYRDDRFSLALALIYPIADVAALAIAVTVLARSKVGQRTVLTLITIAVGVATITDLAFAYLVATDRYGLGNWVDIGWAASLVAFIAAARVGHKAPPPLPPTVSLPSNSSLWLPYVPLLLAGTIGPAVVMSGLEAVVVPIVVVAVCLRQAVAAWENRRLLSVAAQQALQDPLTGLANRILFHDRLAHAMMLRERHGGSVAVVSIDLDDFKLVNDSLGHPVADNLLVHVGRRICGCVRPGDTIARLGGDEFALLLEGDAADSHLIAKRVVDAFGEPFVVDGQDMLMRPSVGVAVAAPDERELTPEALVERADIAMYAAKRSRSSRVHTFSQDTALSAPDVVDSPGRDGQPGSRGGAAQLRLLGELRNAIDDAQLNLVYQPKFDLRTGRIVGVEALLRWQHPQLGLLLPDAFMSLVREHGLMRPVTDLVLAKALDDTARWTASGVRIPMAINLFAPFLRDTELPDALCLALKRRGLPAEMLTVEITEDLILNELGVVTEVLQALRHHGIRVAIDDFGSGYSALSYLRDLPIDEVKLDSHFIASVASDDRAAAVVRAVIDLTHDLGVTLVAEGVEDAWTAAWLRKHGCDVGQGFYFGRPVNPDDVLGLVSVAVEPS